MVSALADALVAAQSRAVAALGKQYVGGQMDEDDLRVALDSIGMTDPTDTARWVAALDIITATGAAVPHENGHLRCRQVGGAIPVTLILPTFCEELEHVVERIDGVARVEAQADASMIVYCDDEPYDDGPVFRVRVEYA